MSLLALSDSDCTKVTLTYGKCEKSPYVESGLWFIHIPRIMAQSTTFLVSEEHARPSVMDEYEKDLEKWGRVAHQIIPGSDWNPQEECLWKDMPFYVHILPDGTPVRYGLSRYQSQGFPKREIWYVVIGLGDQKYTDWNNSPYSAFVVDKICVEPEFMNKMGSNPERWRLICWEAPVGIEPWQVGIDDAMVPDPFFVFKRDEAQLKRPWWRKLMDTVFPETKRRKDLMEKFLRSGDTREEFK